MELHHNLTEEDLKRNEYLDSINREPWPMMFFIMIGFIFLFTTLVLIGVF